MTRRNLFSLHSDKTDQQTIVVMLVNLLVYADKTEKCTIAVMFAQEASAVSNMGRCSKCLIIVDSNVPVGVIVL